MKRILLLFLIILAFVAFSAGPLCATPVLNTNGADGYEDVAGLPYATYANSGEFMGIRANENNLNDDGLLTSVKDWLSLNDESFDTSNLVLGNFTSMVTVTAADGRSGTYEFDTTFCNEWLHGVEFYVVKAAHAYALYYENPVETYGSWSTYDLWDAGYGGVSSVGVSHFTAYAPVPEPATMLLLGSGLIGLAGFGRKKLFKK